MKRKKKSIRRVGLSLSKREFGQMMAALIHQFGEPSQPEYRAKDFSLVGATGKVLNLENAYQEYLLIPHQRRPKLIKAWIRTWFRDEQQVPESFAEARSNLLPDIRRRGTHECDLLEKQGGGKRAITRRVFAGHFALGVAYDWPESKLLVTDHRLSTWEVDLDDAIEVAVDNLRAISQEGFDEAAPGLWVSSWNDSYAPARILLPDVIERCSVRGSHVAMAPHANLLIVTGSEDVEGLERMASLAEESLAGPRPLSGIPLLAVGDGWTPFELPGTHPLAHRYQILRHQTLAGDYPRQGQLLDEGHARRGEDLVAAGVLSGPGGATIACWTEGVATLLPETMYLAFQSPDPGQADVTLHCLGAWDRVREVAGNLMEPQGLYPERHLIRSFPRPEQIEAIRGSGEAVLLELEREMRN
ncbi:hypothetical protein [Singulisphaera acidiphila]|uniref:DUF1444 family protein n=1 Tax=Singulisphaera acidiphila (strain ATCC BAA-1392 / DSM 18658 / VKM B-2454 / MOB10) TaxID=886293 RepID=L0DBC8_SINAD|nr:hypothetical protein [Singulisphaera acidiphila]AGA26165.1 hypothetical protein Sinac_1799 [Singulisphaera acidiphila DSM 18658]